ncbi:Rv1733c family protein [Streptomyces sp. bgisy032]|uniref:Rv1733c family protein n=1 Tax=Streptomyces sp. bgisy032 TaxID=3413773 RepID=UPI003D70EB2C
MSTRNPPHASGPLPPGQEHAAKGTNPLRRTSDRVESWLRGVLMLLLAVGLPVAALSAGTTAYESSLRTVRAQAAERQEVTARLTSDIDGVTTNGKRGAEVRWTDADGTERTGSTLVEPGTAEGAAVRVWVDRDGGLTSPPMNGFDASFAGWFVGGMAAAGVAVAYAAARAGACHLLDRRRYAQWAAEWDVVEPRWSGRHHR